MHRRLRIPIGIRRSIRLLLVLLLVTAPAVRPAVAADDDEKAPVPDFAFYKERVAPIVHGNCAECHADPRKRLGRHFLRPAAGRTIRERDHERNFQTILGLLEPGNPAASAWLLKPLGPRQGGVEHGGGERIRMDSTAYGTMIDFINGATLPRPDEKPAAPRVPRTPEVGAEGLTLPAAAFAEGDDGAREARFRVTIPGVHVVTLAPGAPSPHPRLAFDAGDLVDAPGPLVLLDGTRPLAAVRGALALAGGSGTSTLALRGRPDEACAFLLAPTATYTGVEAEIDVPSEVDGGDDAALLFDMDDVSNGKFLALTDGGRRVVMGVLEGDTARVLASARVPLDDEVTVRRHLRVDVLEGVAIGRLDGRAVVFVNLGRRPETGRVGFRTHGRVTVRGLTLRDRWVVHETAFREIRGAVLTAGEHRLRVAFGPMPPAPKAPKAPKALETVTIRPLSE